MSKFKNKYRIESHRKPNWDYNANGLYFITIVTQNRVCNLGDIINQEMILSDFGKIVENEWFLSFDIRKELILDEFIIMPNHLHAIVEIIHAETHGRASVREIQSNGIQSNEIQSNGIQSNEIQSNEIQSNEIQSNEIQSDGIQSDGIQSNGIQSDGIQSDGIKIIRNSPIRLPKSISSFIGGFKSAVNTKIDDYIDEHKLSIPKYNKNNHFFQPNYHDHIIRNNFEYINIKNYIKNNPLNWKNDSINK